MKHSKKHSMSERSVEKKLRGVQNTQEGIQSLTVWAIHHHDHAERLVTVWLKVMLDSQSPHTLTLMYVCNDIVQNCKRKNAGEYKDLFRKHLPDALSHMSQDESVVASVQRILKIWNERFVFEEDVISEFQECLVSEETRDKIQQEEIDKKLLAEFKPNKVVESLRGFRRLELDADLKYRHITNLRLDMTNSEAIKQLKDRAHGAEYSKQFEDHSKCLEEFNGDLMKVMQERAALIELLELTEHFYELQYGEALVVANAYKNFGLRVSKQEGQLVQIMKAFPASPRRAFSPRGGSSIIASEVIDMEMSDDERGEDDEPPIEPYSPSMLDSPQGPLGSPISPNTSLSDFDIVKGAVQPYDPVESQVQFNAQSLMDNVYNPKMSLEPKNNDLTTRLQHFVPVQGNSNSISADGDGTPTQDEFNDTRKRHASDEYDPIPAKKPAESTITDEDWDLAWEVLEETLASKAVSQSNLTTIQPTADFSALTSNIDTSPLSGLNNSALPAVHSRGLALTLGAITEQNGGPSSVASPGSSKGLNSSLSSTSSDAGVAARNNVDEEDPNAKAQREFLQKLTERGPFKPSRYLQKLTEEKKKPGTDIPVTTVTVANVVAQEADCQFGQYDCQAPTPVAVVTRPKVEYRVGGIARANDSCPVAPVVSLTPSAVPAPVAPPQTPPVVVTPQTPPLVTPQASVVPPQSVGAPGNRVVPATPPFSAPLKRDSFNNDFPVMNTNQAPPTDFRSDFPPMDQDMRQFNPARPPPPPPPAPFMNNSAPRTPSGFPPVGKPFGNVPPPPPPPQRPGHAPRPDFGQFPRMPGQNNSRMDSPPPAWAPVPPRGPPPIPPPFFRPRF